MRTVKQYLTIKEAAAFLGVVPNTLRNWGAAGKIKERRHPISNYRLYKRSELVRMMRQIEKSASLRRVPR